MRERCGVFSSCSDCKILITLFINSSRKLPLDFHSAILSLSTRACAISQQREIGHHHIHLKSTRVGRVILANVLKRPEYTGECQSCFSINPKCLKSYRYLIVGDPKKGELIFRRAVNRWKEARTQEREDEPTFFKLCSDFKWFAQEMS